MLIDTDTFETITGETAPDDFTTLLARTVAIAEAGLGRVLESTEHVENLYVHEDGWVYPANYPVTAVSDPATLNATYDVEPHRFNTGTYTDSFYECTYTAGWTAVSAPRQLQVGLAFAISTLNTPATVSGFDADVDAFKIGDRAETRRKVSPGAIIAADGVEIPVEQSVLAPLGSIAASSLWMFRRKVA